MAETIAPALTPEEWQQKSALLEAHMGRDTAVSVVDSHFVLRAHDTWRGERYTAAVSATPHHLVRIIALANAALPDDDPRKITRVTIAEIRNAAENVDHEWGGPDADLWRIADVLESFLPPR